MLPSGACGSIGGVVEASSIDTNDASGDESPDTVGPQFRYGFVFVLMLTLVVFLIATPDASWSRAIATVISGAALVVAITTARVRRAQRRRGIVGVTVLTAVVGVTVIAGIAPKVLTSTFGVLIGIAVPCVIISGLLRLLRDRGVTLQAVAGGLVIYLSLGLAFAYVISFIAEVASSPYFAQNTNGTLGERVYFSFTTLTTTGYGDLSPGLAVGRSVSVVEMLTGQLYLALVIGLMIGNLVGRSQLGQAREGRRKRRSS
jgi:Ion channel